MSKKRTPGKTPPTVNIVVQRDVNGSIIVGNENQINRRASFLFSSGQGIVFAVLAILRISTNAITATTANGSSNMIHCRNRVVNVL